MHLDFTPTGEHVECLWREYIMMAAATSRIAMLGQLFLRAFGTAAASRSTMYAKTDDLVVRLAETEGAV